MSCTPSGLCVAADRSGRVLTSTDPLAGGSSWSSATSITKSALTGVSCASVSLCAATDTSGEVLVSTDPTAVTPQWVATPLEVHGSLSGISCVEGLCAAVSSGGYVAVSTQPAGGSWRVRADRPLPSDDGRDVCRRRQLPRGRRSRSGSRERQPGRGVGHLGRHPGDARRAPSPGRRAPPEGCAWRCRARGEAFDTDQLTSTVPAWELSLGASGVALAGVSCLPGGACVGVDNAGRALVGLDPPPACPPPAPARSAPPKRRCRAPWPPTTPPPSRARFEYGTTSGYGRSVPCSSTPAANAGAQQVGAQLAGLSPNTTYHFRLLAGTPRGSGATADGIFTTRTSSAIRRRVPPPLDQRDPGRGPEAHLPERRDLDVRREALLLVDPQPDPDRGSDLLDLHRARGRQRGAPAVQGDDHQRRG